MSCKNCNRDVPIENEDTGLCATCNKADRDNDELYPDIKKMFLQKMVDIEAHCPVFHVPITMDSDVHHMWGRVGYANEEKRQSNISLLIDVDFFLACSRLGHKWIEDNREMAILKGWIIERSLTHSK